jgi:hypothetical protein
MKHLALKLYASAKASGNHYIKCQALKDSYTRSNPIPAS